MIDIAGLVTDFLRAIDEFVAVADVEIDDFCYAVDLDNCTVEVKVGFGYIIYLQTTENEHLVVRFDEHGIMHNALPIVKRFVFSLRKEIFLAEEDAIEELKRNLSILKKAIKHAKSKTLNIEST